MGRLFGASLLGGGAFVLSCEPLSKLQKNDNGQAKSFAKSVRILRTKGVAFGATARLLRGFKGGDFPPFASILITLLGGYWLCWLR